MKRRKKRGDERSRKKPYEEGNPSNLLGRETKRRNKLLRRVHMRHQLQRGSFDFLKKSVRDKGLQEATCRLHHRGRGEGGHVPALGDRK